MPHAGEIAALTTATLWAFASLLFTLIARRSGAFALNLTRITIALLVLTTVLTVTRGPGWLLGAERRDLAILAISGFIGLTVGDWSYFNALSRLGPRLGALMMTLAPPTAALLAIPFLGESLGLLAVAGMAVTLSGVAWVVLERTPTPVPRGHRVLGVFYGALGSFGQGFGLVLSKVGMAGGIDPLAATGIRMLAATVGVWVLALSGGWLDRVGRLARDRVSLWASVLAAVIGPVFGVWLSLVAVKHADAGVAATLMATTPVIIVPLVVLLYKERVSFRAVLGALVAVAGVAMLFWA